MPKLALSKLVIVSSGSHGRVDRKLPHEVESETYSLLARCNIIRLIIPLTATWFRTTYVQKAVEECLRIGEHTIDRKARLHRCSPHQESQRDRYLAATDLTAGGRDQPMWNREYDGLAHALPMHLELGLVG